VKIVGLTGGIGSGKTTVAKFFSELGIPVYIADIEARNLSNSSESIRQKMVALLGENAYSNGTLNRKFVAERIFSDPLLLNSVNSIIHPEVDKHFKNWVSRQKGVYVIKEAAILFENGGHKKCDLVILVTAPKDIRIARVKARDKTAASEIEKRMDNQWSDEKKEKLADIILPNITLEITRRKVHQIHTKLLGHFQNP